MDRLLESYGLLDLWTQERDVRDVTWTYFRTWSYGLKEMGHGERIWIELINRTYCMIDAYR